MRYYYWLENSVFIILAIPSTVFTFPPYYNKVLSNFPLSRKSIFLFSFFLFSFFLFFFFFFSLPWRTDCVYPACSKLRRRTHFTTHFFLTCSTHDQAPKVPSNIGFGLRSYFNITAVECIGTHRYTAPATLL